MLNAITYEVGFWGLNGCLETLVSQAYGANNFKMCGIYKNRAIFLSFIYFAVLSIPQFFAKSIFNDIMGRDEDVSEQAADVYRVLSVGNFFSMMSLILCFYSVSMSDQNIIIKSFGLATVIFIIQIIVQQRFVDPDAMTISFAISISYLLRLIFCILIVYCNKDFKLPNAQRFFKAQTINRLGYQFRLGLAALLFMFPAMVAQDIALMLANAVSESAFGA